MSENEQANGIIEALATMPPDAILDERAMAEIFHRCPTSIRRAVTRGELPRGVKMFGKQTWTAKAVLDHVNHRLEAAKQDRQRLERRISALSP